MNRELHIELHKELIRIRKAEVTLAERYKQQEMRTPAHFGVGQEAVAVGVCAALKDSDVAYSHHRSHNHFLAKGGSVYHLAAELFGRETGCSRGRGGSVHLTCREKGFIASSAILGESVSVATGSALSFKMDGSDRISVAFFGDAVAEEGAFYECLNYAALKHLPILYVCENNGFATESPLSIRQPSRATISGRASSLQVQVRQADGNNVDQVYQTTAEIVQHMRTQGGPFLLECKTYRWLEHVGPHFDHDLNRTYRSKEDLAEWQKKCPLVQSERVLLENQWATRSEIAQWEDTIQSEINSDIERAYQDPWPVPSRLLEYVY